MVIRSTQSVVLALMCFHTFVFSPFFFASFLISLSLLLHTNTTYFTLTPLPLPLFLPPRTKVLEHKMDSSALSRLFQNAQGPSRQSVPQPGIDTPTPDTAEIVQVSSLALLKVHQTFSYSFSPCHLSQSSSLKLGASEL